MLRCHGDGRAWARLSVSIRTERLGEGVTEDPAETAVAERSGSDARTWWLYVLECVDGSLYTGISVDVARRYRQHCRGTAAAYTRSRPPLRLVGAIAVGTRASALKLEYAFKQLAPREKRVRAVAMGLAGAVAPSGDQLVVAGDRVSQPV